MRLGLFPTWVRIPLSPPKERQIAVISYLFFNWYLKSTIYCAVIVSFFKNESFVSLTRIAANMNTNPITEKSVNDSIPISTGIKIPNIDSNPKIIAAVDGFVYFCPMF